MPNVSMVMFDLAGTTVQDDNAVAKCLHQAALEYGLPAALSQIETRIGTNKIHLFQSLIAESQGRSVSVDELEKKKDPATYEEARRLFDRYTEIMIDHYRQEVRGIPGAEDTFRWCRAHGIKVATDTGFHRDVTDAIMAGLGWVENGLVDLAVDVEHVGGVGRPAPFMIHYAMRQLDVHNVNEVIKVGDTPADMLEGYHAGCRGIVGVLSGPIPLMAWGKYRHTHVIASVAELPELIEREF